MLAPKAGLVIRYDYLWRDQQRAGLESGKDRPSAIVLASAERPDGSREVLLCAITHSPPGKEDAAVRMPEGVARHLGLDDQPCWIKTDEVNTLVWEKGRIPHGVSQTPKGTWSYGMLPQALGREVFEQVREKARRRALGAVRRDQ
jgi:hypothetical protein